MLSSWGQHVINALVAARRMEMYGNISIGIRKIPRDISFLSMNGLAYLVDNVKPSNGKKAGLSRDADEYKPMRDAVMHTALLTDGAKRKLSSVIVNVKERIKTLLS